MRISAAKIAGFLLVAIVSVGGYALFDAFALRPPNPTNLSREELLRALVVYDLRTAPDKLQKDFVVALEDELKAGLDLKSTKVQLTDSQLNRLGGNIELLATIWLQEHLLPYFELPLDQRAAYLEGVLDELSTWPAVKQVFSPIALMGLMAQPKNAQADTGDSADPVGEIRRRIARAFVMAVPEESRRFEIVSAASVLLLRRSISG